MYKKQIRLFKYNQDMPAAVQEKQKKSTAIAMVQKVFFNFCLQKILEIQVT